MSSSSISSSSSSYQNKKEDDKTNLYRFILKKKGWRFYWYYALELFKYFRDRIIEADIKNVSSELKSKNDEELVSDVFSQHVEVILSDERLNEILLNTINEYYEDVEEDKSNIILTTMRKRYTETISVCPLIEILYKEKNLQKTGEIQSLFEIIEDKNQDIIELLVVSYKNIIIQILSGNINTTESTRIKIEKEISVLIEGLEEKRKESISEYVREFLYSLVISMMVICSQYVARMRRMNIVSSRDLTRIIFSVVSLLFYPAQHPNNFFQSQYISRKTNMKRVEILNIIITSNMPIDEYKGDGRESNWKISTSINPSEVSYGSKKYSETEFYVFRNNWLNQSWNLYQNLIYSHEKLHDIYNKRSDIDKISPSIIKKEEITSFSSSSSSSSGSSMMREKEMKEKMPEYNTREFRLITPTHYVNSLKMKHIRATEHIKNLSNEINREKRKKNGKLDGSTGKTLIYAKNESFSNLISKISSIHMSLVCFILFKVVRFCELESEIDKSSSAQNPADKRKRNPEIRDPDKFVWFWPKYRGSIDQSILTVEELENTKKIDPIVVFEESKHTHSFRQTRSTLANLPSHLIREHDAQDVSTFDIGVLEKNFDELQRYTKETSHCIGVFESKMSDNRLNRPPRMSDQCRVARENIFINLEKLVKIVSVIEHRIIALRNERNPSQLRFSELYLNNGVVMKNNDIDPNLRRQFIIAGKNNSSSSSSDQRKNTKRLLVTHYNRNREYEEGYFPLQADLLEAYIKQSKAVMRRAENVMNFDSDNGRIFGDMAQYKKHKEKSNLKYDKEYNNKTSQDLNDSSISIE